MIEHLELKDASELLSLDVNKLKSPTKKIDFRSNKWTFYFLDQKEIDFLEETAHRIDIPTISDYADVEVGITTGSNDFFTVPLSTVREYDLQKYAKPMVGRSVQVNSAIFTEDDWRQNRDSNAKAHLLVFPSKDRLNGHQGVHSYIRRGEELNIHTGYKTRIRDDWFVVPSIKLSDALFIRRNNRFPRLILNQAGAYTTDTMHRVFIKPEVNPEAFVASFYNSLSLAFSEIVGRSYGGGVLELMPSEAGSIALPFDCSNGELLSVIDRMMRKKTPVDEILKITNSKILKENYDFTIKEINLANEIWRKLSFRRLNRKNS